jgi:hypothetical protein
MRVQMVRRFMDVCREAFFAERIGPKEGRVDAKGEDVVAVPSGDGVHRAQ